ncbi:hypothetical protein [Roseburia sp. AF25-25LB]|nr:hypothetical protein [Roseburia sp. AF25-25LB]RHQ37881.1 hypothetical protein DWY49_14505 [Roseburia sp. AF25-25LB]
MYALANISELFYQQHEDNKDVYDAICEAEQNLKDAAEERETQGVWKTVAGVGLLVVGGVCIVASWGTATPIVAAAEGIVGTGTTIFGVADSAEGAQDIYYGSIGDIDSTAVNDLKYVVFQGNEEAYYLTESVFAFAASAMIPIGQAASAGNLTFRSGATIVAKEGIATAAGAGAQKYTTDLTGNQTAGMLAGMAASMATAKGLNGIEAGAKKLAKPKLGDVGTDGGAVLNDADVGSAVNGGTSSKIGYEYLDDQLGNLKDKVKINQYQSAESVNAWWEARGYKSPYKEKTVVQDITLTEDTKFVRVYDGVNSNLEGGWVMRAEDIKGLTPKEIQAKFALEYEPKFIGEVELKAGDTVRLGEVGPNFGFDGGGIQIDLQQQWIGDFTELGKIEDWR